MDIITTNLGYRIVKSARICKFSDQCQVVKLIGLQFFTHYLHLANCIVFLKTLYSQINSQIDSPQTTYSTWSHDVVVGLLFSSNTPLILSPSFKRVSLTDKVLDTSLLTRHLSKGQGLLQIFRWIAALGPHYSIFRYVQHIFSYIRCWR